MPEQEIRIEARMRNNRLWHAIFDSYDSVAHFCREHGFVYQVVWRLLNLKGSAFTRGDGDYRPVCKRLAQVLGYLVEDLFPARIYSLEVTKVVREYSFTELASGGRELALLPAPHNVEEDVMRHDLAERMSEALELLSPRKQVILRLHFGLGGEREWTLKEIGEFLGVTRERVRQIEIKAFLDLQGSSVMFLFQEHSPVVDAFEQRYRTYPSPRESASDRTRRRILPKGFPTA